MSDNPKIELESFQMVHSALVNLDEEARARVIFSVSTLLGINAPVVAPEKTRPSKAGQENADFELSNDDTRHQDFNEFAELYSTTDPNTNADKALVAGYWLQECQGAENFTGHSVNAELNHLGHKLSNVTVSLSSLINVKPNLVLQLRKSGKTKQARKTYKLSTEGNKRVKEMINAA